MSWSRRSVVRVLPVSLASWIGLAAYGQSDAQQSAENLVKMHEAWGLRASTPGASLVLRESMRSGQVIKFTLTVAGVPKGDVYTLVGIVNLSTIRLLDLQDVVVTSYREVDIL